MDWEFDRNISIFPDAALTLAEDHRSNGLKKDREGSMPGFDDASAFERITVDFYRTKTISGIAHFDDLRCSSVLADWVSTKWWLHVSETSFLIRVCQVRIDYLNFKLFIGLV